MTHTMTRSPAPLRDVLYEFSLAQDVPNAELLDEFVRRYPEHAAALTDFAIELAVDSLRRDEAPAPVADPAEVSPAVSRAMSRFQNSLHQTRALKSTKTATEPAQTAVPNPFSTLSRDAFRTLAEGLHANSAFVCKLRDRVVQPKTMSDGFVQHVANKMAVPPIIILTHFAAPPQINRQQRYKADQKPEAGTQQTFEEAVRTSGLTEEQQRYLLSL